MLAVEVAFVHVHDRPLRASRTVRKTEAFVKMARGEVRFVDADVHGVGTAGTSLLESGLHQRAPKSPAPSGGDDVKLSQVALQTTAPDRGAEPKNRQPIGTVADEKNNGIAALEQVGDPLCQVRRRRRWIIKLAVEIVK